MAAHRKLSAWTDHTGMFLFNSGSSLSQVPAVSGSHHLLSEALPCIWREHSWLQPLLAQGHFSSQSAFSQTVSLGSGTWDAPKKGWWSVTAEKEASWGHCPPKIQISTWGIQSWPLACSASKKFPRARAGGSFRVHLGGLQIVLENTERKLFTQSTWHHFH